MANPLASQIPDGPSDKEVAYIDDHIACSLDVMRRAAGAPAFRDQVLAVARLCTATLRAGGKIMSTLR